MANWQHIAILNEALEKKDIDIWNQWRRDNPDVRPDLSLASLGRSNLGRVDLTRTDLIGSDLSEADLYRADLFEADLYGVSLFRANLYRANIKEVNLRKANLSGVTCGHTTFGNVDLSEVRGLETANHKAPSTIGIDTLYRSKGNIPREFLENCGVPQTMLDYATSLTGKTSRFYFCFISHSYQDKEFCQHLAERMKTEGLRVWYMPDNTNTRRKLTKQINKMLGYHEKLILVLSKSSMNSEWVQTEIRRALERERDGNQRVLFPIRLTDHESLQEWELFDSHEGRDLAQEIQEYYIPDFSHWKDHDSFSEAFKRLLEDLRKDE